MNRTTFRVAQGVSLIELMIALAISSFLLLGLIQVFSASRTAYQLSEGLARTQENSRFAMDFLQRDLRMAGHFGCTNDQARFLPENDQGAARQAMGSLFLTQADRDADDYAAAPHFALAFHVGIQGYEAAGTGPGDTLEIEGEPAASESKLDWIPAMPDALWAAIQGSAIAGSDIVVLRYLVPEGAPVTTFAPGVPQTTIQVPSASWNLLTAGVENPGLFGISDCGSVTLFQATTTTPGTGTMTARSGVGLNQSPFGATDQFAIGQATLHRAEVIAYYIGIGTGQVPALFRVRFASNPGAGLASLATGTREELVEGVESMQLLYGQDNNANAATRPTGYISSSTTADVIAAGTDPLTGWRRVGIVQLGMLVRSSERTATAQAGNAHSVLGVAIDTSTANDQRYRDVYETTIALRNRLYGN